MADRPDRNRSKTDHDIIEYNFRIELDIATHPDEKRLRELVLKEMLQLKAAVDSKKR